MDEIQKLRHALEESVKLQSHYAKLLNMYDGGKRKQFDSADEWLHRLEETATHRLSAELGRRARRKMKD